MTRPPGLNRRWLLPVLAAIACVCLRLAMLRSGVCLTDEAVYATEAGTMYADYLRHGDFKSIILSRDNYEHPPLVKLFYGAAVAATGARTPEGVLYVSRWVSLLFTALQVMMLCALSPLAALFFCFQSQDIYYSGRAFLDGPSTCIAFGAIYFFLRSEEAWGWELGFSALLAGAAMAAKYINAVAVLPIAIWMAFAFRKRPRAIAAYWLIALAGFFALDPALWSHPTLFLKASLVFHNSLTTVSPRYQQYMAFVGHKPKWWTHFGWMIQTRPDPLIPSPPGLDGAVFFLGLAGLPLLWRRSPLLGIWYATAAVFLAVYPIKFSHYTLALAPVMCLSAAGICDRLSRDFRINVPRAAEALFYAAAISGLFFAWLMRDRRPDLSPARSFFAVTQLKLGHREEALRVLKDEDTPAAHLVRSELFQDQGELPQAEAEAREAVRLAPTALSARLRLGTALLTEGKYDEAIDQLRTVNLGWVADVGLRAAVDVELGKAYIAKGDAGLALTALNAAHRLEPQDETIPLLQRQALALQERSKR